MEIREITDGKKRYLSLLLLADEQEDMIDRYLERGMEKPSSTLSRENTGIGIVFSRWARAAAS